MTPVIWLSRHQHIDAIGPWDTGILRRMFEGGLWPTGANLYSDWVTVAEIPERFRGEPAVVVLPARHHYDDLDWLNDQLAQLPSVLLILSSDEDARFPWRKIKHPNLRLWVQSGDDTEYADCTWAYYFGYGWRYEFPDWAGTFVPRHGNRLHLWSFAGQVTNPARERAVIGMRRAQGKVPGRMVATNGFSQGVPGDQYAEMMAESWIIPCPAGPQTLDTFRLYEALESGCIPLVDQSMPDGTMSRFWEHLYPAGFPIFQAYNWPGVGGDIEEILPRAEHLSAQASAWWQQTKRAMVKRLEDDLVAIGVPVERWTRVTALVTTSPVASNPSLDIIKQTIASLPPNIEVVVAFDGVRPEQAHLTEAYDEYVYRMTMWCEHDAPAAVPVIAPHWLHQVGTTRMALELVDTDVVLFMEHDTPLVTDQPIGWKSCADLVADGHLDMLRFHHEAQILDVHERLMIDHKTRTMLDVPLRRTKQWSQRPALYNTGYLRAVLAEHFSKDARCFIEDKMHSVAQNELGHRLAIYHPDDGNIKRSLHLDGRAGADKYDTSQIF